MRNFIIYLACGIIIFLVGYIAGGRNAICDFATGQNAVDVMLLTAIHRDLASGDIEGARQMAATAIESHVLAIQNVEEHPFIDSCLDFLPWNRNNTTKAMVDRYLADAESHFAKNPGALNAKAITYLTSRKKE